MGIEKIVLMAPYIMSIMFPIFAIVSTSKSVEKDIMVAAHGNVGTAFVAVCGFCVFPILNIIAAIWLLAEIREYEDERSNQG